MNFLEILRLIFGTIYVLFIPGLIISFIFFPKKQISWLARIALSIVLSLAVVSIAVFTCNLFGIKINAPNVFLEVLIILIISLITLFVIKKFKK